MQEKGLCPAEVIFIGRPGGGRFQQNSINFGAVHVSGEDGDDRSGYLVLDRENVVEFPVVPLGPGGTCRGIGKLRLMRTRSPLRLTLPSSTYCTANSPPTCRISSAFPLYWNVELRAMTNSWKTATVP